MYEPTILAVYSPAMLVIHWLYTSVWASYTGNFVVPGPVYGPTMLAIHHPYTGVSPNYTGSFVILSLVVVHRCMTQLCWHFCNLLFNVSAIEIGHILVVHWCMSRGIWLQNPQYSWSVHPVFTDVWANICGILWQCFNQLYWQFFHWKRSRYEGPM